MDEVKLLGIDKLVKYVSLMCDTTSNEIILATSATVEGQTTAHYIAERLQEFLLLFQDLPMAPQ